MTNNNNYQKEKAEKALIEAKKLEKKQIKKGAKWIPIFDNANSLVLTKNQEKNKMIEYINQFK